jgi:RNA polymerase sigma factor (sigma-70 family)
LNYTTKAVKLDITKYYQKICKFAPLNRKDEEDLIRIYKSKRSTEEQKAKAKRDLINSNLRFCFKQAKYFSKNDPSIFEELIGAANEGILIGLEKFDPSKKMRFLSYAGYWVFQRILKTMSQMRIVSLPLYKQQLSTRIRKFQDKNGKVNLAQLKKEFPDASEKDLQELSGTRYLTYYIDDLEEDSGDLAAVTENLIEGISNKHVKETVYAMPSPYKEVLILSYGLEDGTELNTQQLCKRLILTRDQLKEIKAKGLAMLKVSLSDS